MIDMTCLYHVSEHVTLSIGTFVLTDREIDNTYIYARGTSKECLKELGWQDLGKT
jgi:hypothetical protein